MSHRFALAPMSPLFRGLTIALWLLPLVFGLLALFLHDSSLGIIMLLLLLLYAVVWFACRPSSFDLNRSTLEIVFPIWRRRISLQQISGVRRLDQNTFQQEFGWAIRIGVGGLWGGFGWLWTQRRGLLEFYISQVDRFVLIERSNGKNLLITPENPEQFVEMVQEIIA